MKIKNNISKVLAITAINKIVNKIGAFGERLYYLNKYAAWRSKQETGDEIKHFKTKQALREFVLMDGGLSDIPLDYLEFGVCDGTSIKCWLDFNKHSDSCFYGFDTFTGLPEKWENADIGLFTCHGNPPDILDERVRFIKGLFQETLIPFLQTFKRKETLVLLVDADLYSANYYVLIHLLPMLKKGDFIIMDDVGITVSGYRALEEALRSSSVEYQVIGEAVLWHQVAMRIL